mgnify:CR=1 FL=1
MDELTSQFPYEIGIDFKYIETIDHGAFGTVIHVIEISTNKDMAIKVINKSNSRSSLIKKIKEEISILKKLNHENIVKFFGFFETNNQLLIKMEYVKYGTLSKWMKNNKKISEQEASIILKQIFSAIEYLHGKQICHRDIKPENIMLSKENDLNSIKIVDFGLSASNFDKLINHDYCGTYIYMAPEQIEKKLYFISVDIWSIGILMFMLLNNGKHPFYVKGIERKDFNKKIQSCKINFYNKISPMAKHLIFKLLEPNPSWRYNASQAIKHPWITRNKYDEVPLTFNEILHKSNMKKIGRNLLGVVLFLNYFTKNKIFLINDKYEKKCFLFNEKIKNKINKKIERCLDVLSTCEDEQSNSDCESKIEKNNFVKKIEKHINNLNNNNSNIQNSFLISNIKLSERKKLNFAKSTKSIEKINRILNTDKKSSLTFRKIEKINLFPIKKVNDNSKNKRESNNIFKKHCINISINLQNNNNNTKEFCNRNSINDMNKQYKSYNKCKSLRIMNNPKKCKINNIYEEKKTKKNLPEINTPLKKLNMNNNKFSMNESENYTIVPLFLPNIHSLLKINNSRRNLKKYILHKEFKKQKNS